ncbi:MAG: NADPH:quinone oxidoreductase family protein [Hyphomicrobiales bacterium]|nr:MAG: NADPH:quinone oxidoreductase family protein [Hyphomicrobiales bacterium]
MKSWIITGTGEPRDVSSLGELESPEPGPGELVLQTRHAGLNLADTLLCRGRYQDAPPVPFVPGLELSGVVHLTGQGTNFLRGQRVLSTPGLPHTDVGALSEYVVVAEKETVAIPDSVSFEQAAALPVAYVTADLALHRRGHLQAGETLLVQGASGGVGAAAVQLGKAAGATVIAVAGGVEKTALCHRLGAHHTIDDQRVDVVTTVLELTAGKGVDVVVDPVGGAAFEDSRRCIAVDGRLLVIGFASGDIPTLPVNRTLLRGFAVVGVNRDLCRREQPEIYRESLQRVVDRVAAGELDPWIDTVMDMSEVLDGWDRLEKRDVKGKLLIRVAS